LFDLNVWIIQDDARPKGGRHANHSRTKRCTADAGSLGDLDLYELVFKILAGFLSFGSKTA
ncbi:hypothetical protein, partial [Bacteroides uniformis]|uniref:hypothetical protein n=1 Tax=Bacteroides uniformis TaxID=820 RepID=UPI001EDEA273